MVERFELKRGLDIPLSGAPQQVIDIGPSIQTVGIVASDYLGMSPTMLVAEGDRVRAGQVLFSDKKNEGVQYTSPVSGVIRGIHRGEKRRFLGVVIQVEGDEAVEIVRPTGPIDNVARPSVIEALLKSGLWTSLRSRPYGKVPAPAATPHAIFVTAIDTNPLAADPAVVVAESSDHFVLGLQVLARLTDGKVFVCRGHNSKIPGEGMNQVQVAEFTGPHPAGLVGTHMHFLNPVSSKRANWYLHYQDVIAIGKFWLTGRVDGERVIALGGPKVARPRLLRTLQGASIDDLVRGQLSEGDVRVISGPPLCGKVPVEPMRFVGRYHLQVSALEEGRQRELLGWQMPGFDKFSVTRSFASAWTGRKSFGLTTSTGGSERAMVPIGTYEQVMPHDLLPTLLLRALITRDIERAADLGCLELEEEDLGLCTFVCPGKYEYGEILRDNLMLIEKEG